MSGVNDETDPNGSSGVSNLIACKLAGQKQSVSNKTEKWIVERVTLFSTTAYWVATNECATISNAAIANSRIINAGEYRRTYTQCVLVCRWLLTCHILSLR